MRRETQKAHDELVGRLEKCLNTGEVFGDHRGEINIFMLTTFHRNFICLALFCLLRRGSVPWTICLFI